MLSNTIRDNEDSESTIVEIKICFQMRTFFYRP